MVCTGCCEGVRGKCMDRQVKVGFHCIDGFDCMRLPLHHLHSGTFAALEPLSSSMWAT